MLAQDHDPSWDWGACDPSRYRQRLKWHLVPLFAANSVQLQILVDPGLPN